MNNNYYFFWKHKISQWTYSPFTIDNIDFNIAEQYMMYKKAELFDDKDYMTKILNSNNPKEQKDLGRKVKNFNEDKWNSVRERVVYDGNYAKFSQNPDLLQRLFETENKILVEASPIR